MHTQPFLLILTFFFLFCGRAFSQEKSSEQPLIFHFEIKEMIAPGARRTVNQAIDQAEELNADYIILELNTYGGLVDAADSIRTKLLNTPIPTVSWINNNAASAGALISIACDSIYMSRGANIGATTVVNQSGEKAPDKYQSYMRSTMRSTAEAQGRDPRIAEAMVDESIVVEGISKEGEVITFTTSEAIANNYCEGEANSLKAVIEEHLNISDYKLKHYTKSFSERIISFLLNPVVSSVLMFMMVGGIWFEIQTPGLGIPIVAAILGAILYFMPLYLEGLTENWEILLFVVGILLLIAEVFIIPGFGVAGIGGILCIVVALTLSLVDNSTFDFTSDGLEELTFPLLRVIGSLSVLFILSLFLTPLLFKNSRFKQLILETSTRKEDGYTVLEKHLPGVVGKEGKVINELKPIGRIEIDDEYYSARSIAGWVDAGETVRVIHVDVNNLVVRKI